MEKNRQHERTDGEYKLRDGNSRKASYSHAKLSGGDLLGGERTGWMLPPSHPIGCPVAAFAHPIESWTCGSIVSWWKEIPLPPPN